MNGLALRISNCGGKKMKNSQSFAKLDVSQYISQELLTSNKAFSIFSNATTAEEQLTALKPILEEEANIHQEYGDCTIQSIQFLVKIFFHAEVKHPVKCFLARHITRNSLFQTQFSDILLQEILLAISNKPVSYKKYIEVLTKLSCCIENFQPGAVSVKKLQLEIGLYLKDCLRCCIETLRNSRSLSPTEKSEIFNLAHLALRLFLYIVQKVSLEYVEQSTSIFSSVKQSINELLFDADAPMDTKSVCGMLYLNMHILENGPDSWVDILQADTKNQDIASLLSNSSAELSLYSAIATVVTIDKLQAQVVHDDSALVILCKKILDIGERSSTESMFTLGVTRTLVQISKYLEKLSDNSLGQALVASLLSFVWTHLEHYMDSVRHLTAQLLGNIVKYCSRLDKEGNPEALTSLFETLNTYLDPSRKSYYVSLTSLVLATGGAAVTSRRPSLLADVINALSLQHVQASATTFLEVLLQKHVKETDTETIHQQWIEPILVHVHSNNLDSTVLNVLENLLVKAVHLDSDIIHYILPHIKQSTTDLKCVLMLLRVAQKSGVTTQLTETETEWKGLISYDVLNEAAVDAIDEIRILSLSLIIESPKTTEVFSQGELNFILRFLKYNINAQSPNFRQLTLSLMKKFIKRLEDSHKVFMKRKDQVKDYYTTFVEELRRECFESLIPGANYSRRCGALQVLAWSEGLWGGQGRIWTEDYVEKLLLHLEDSYETNKALALEILNGCPSSLLTCKTYSISLELEDILKQATLLKPTECVSAAYKLDLLRTKLPQNIVPDESCNASVSSRVTYTLLQRLQHTLLAQLAYCERSIVSAAIDAPMYTVLHCMVHLMTRIDVDELSSDKQWSELISDMIATCIRVNDAVASVVNSASPEGHLPMDMGLVLTDHGNSSGVRLEDGRQVTAQMVLLCAWRSVKEVSLLLGEISCRLSIAGEDSSEGILTPSQLVLIGDHFTKLLAETKHRGAFEQAYVGFTKLLARLWRCRTSSLHELPRIWLSELMEAIQSADKRDTLCTTRRGAGLPFMIQALVTTELQVQDNPKCFHECMTVLLHLARPSPSNTQESEMAIETRTHSLNILRALFRNSALDESVSGYVGEGLMVALEGFEGRTWMERNSSTLLFSALMVRVFGVQRSKDADRLCVRNRMTGRIFFLRYPHLYDYMLKKLKEVSSSENDQQLRPSLYPILLLLARLYPSSLEGTVSNLKLEAFIPLVLCCCSSGVLNTRQLAAKAMVPLIPPHHYFQHLQTMLTLIGDQHIKRNYCHGILLQLTRLLDAKVECEAEWEGVCPSSLVESVRGSMWLLSQPCCLLTLEYVKLITLLLWRFPSLIDKDMTDIFEEHLYSLLFRQNIPRTNAAKDICLSNSLYLYFIILSKNKNNAEEICDIVLKSLTHQSYDVILTCLNFLLILHECFETDNRFEEYLNNILNLKPKSLIILNKLNEDPMYTQLLCEVLKTNKYLECQQKALKVLSLEINTEKLIVKTKLHKKYVKITDEIIINTLIGCVNMEHENVSHIYLESLSNFVSKILKQSAVRPDLMLNILRAMFACSTADNNESTRSVVVRFLDNHIEELFMMSLFGLSKEAKFEFKATIYAILVTLLEDDDVGLRQRTSNIIIKLFNTLYSIPSLNEDSKVISSKSGELLRHIIESNEEYNVAIFVMLALLDFKSEVCMNDENDEYRVFDQHERYNINLEETVWTKECANIIRHLINKTHTNVPEIVLTVVHDDVLRRTLNKLCNNNLLVFKKMLHDEFIDKKQYVNPKIRLFVNILRR